MPHAEKTLGDPATPLLRARIRAVFRHLPKGLAGDEESVHQMRVAGRRLRVALPILARRPRGKRVRRALRILRDLTRAAGGSRDVDVIAGLFGKHLRELGPATPERATLRRRLLAVRARSRTRMAEMLLDLEIAQLRRDLRTAVSRRGEGLFTALLRVRQTRDLGGEVLLAALGAVGDRFEPEALHRLRIRARRLRYLAEVLDALKGQESEAPLLFKEVQERLGRIHDTVLLASWLGRQGAAAEGRGQGALAGEARVLEAHFVEAARGHHRELLEKNPAALVTRALEAMGRARTAA